LTNIYLVLCLFLVNLAYGQKPYSPRNFVKECKKYKGTPYLFGGNDKKGIDCSGIVHNAFTTLDVSFPRVSYQQAEVFNSIKLNRAKKGDLIYFKTSGNRINHTGVVLKKKGKKKLMFLHASSSGGVRIDNLYSIYWENKFVKITRPKIDIN
jgi:probable lipoprotein NlpC